MLVNTKEAKAALDVALRDLCRDFNAGIYTPILEADVSAFLYHRLLVNGCVPSTVYLATRICGEAERTRKPDLVIGTLQPKSACIHPVLICEVKAFQRWGLSDQQMRRRFEGILAEDIPCLQEMSAVLPDGRVEIVADFFVSTQRQGYLTGKWGDDRRIDVVAAECRRIGASLVWIRAQNEHEIGFEYAVDLR